MATTWWAWWPQAQAANETRAPSAADVDRRPSERAAAVDGEAEEEEEEKNHRNNDEPSSSGEEGDTSPAPTEATPTPPPGGGAPTPPRQIRTTVAELVATLHSGSRTEQASAAELLEGVAAKEAAQREAVQKVREQVFWAEHFAAFEKDARKRARHAATLEARREELARLKRHEGKNAVLRHSAVRPLVLVVQNGTDSAKTHAALVLAHTATADKAGQAMIRTEGGLHALVAVLAFRREAQTAKTAACRALGACATDNPTNRALIAEIGGSSLLFAFAKGSEKADASEDLQEAATRALEALNPAAPATKKPAAADSSGGGGCAVQ